MHNRIVWIAFFGCGLLCNAIFTSNLTSEAKDANQHERVSAVDHSELGKVGQTAQTSDVIEIENVASAIHQSVSSEAISEPNPRI